MTANTTQKSIQEIAKDYAAGIHAYYLKNKPATLGIETAVSYAVEAWLTEIRVWGDNSVEYAKADLQYWQEKWTQA